MSAQMSVIMGHPRTMSRWGGRVGVLKIAQQVQSCRWAAIGRGLAARIGQRDAVQVQQVRTVLGGGSRLTGRLCSTHVRDYGRCPRAQGWHMRMSG